MVAGTSGVEAAEVVRALNRRFQSGDQDGAAALLAPDVVIEQPTSLPHGGRHHGAEGMGHMAATFAQHWARAISSEADVQGSERGAVQVTSQTWTSHATGKSCTVDVVELFTVVDGRVTEIRVFQQDTHALLATLDATE